MGESEAMRVGESESVRGAMTMRERETERDCVRCEAVCCVRQ